MTQLNSAASNLTERVVNNPYPGRGIVLGRLKDGCWVQLYWIMGRSANSRNRVFESEGTLLRTAAADPSKVQDPSLIIYNAMRELNHAYVVTNGKQTDQFIEGLEVGRTFADTTLMLRHEPDAPNHTPRINGCILLEGQPPLVLSIAKANPHDAEKSEHHLFYYQDVPLGMGYAITTYQGDGNPLPSFEGIPFQLPLEGCAEEVLETYWNALNRDNRISLALKTIVPENGGATLIIKNRYQPVH